VDVKTSLDIKAAQKPTTDQFTMSTRTRFEIRINRLNNIGKYMTLWGKLMVTPPSYFGYYRSSSGWDCEIANWAENWNTVVENMLGLYRWWK
jgi:hypothetical protein